MCTFYVRRHGTAAGDLRRAARKAKDKAKELADAMTPKKTRYHQNKKLRLFINSLLICIQRRCLFSYENRSKGTGEVAIDARLGEERSQAADEK